MCKVYPGKDKFAVYDEKNDHVCKHGIIQLHLIKGGLSETYFKKVISGDRDVKSYEQRP